MKMEQSTHSNLPPFIVVTGREGSGKDVYASHLAHLGYLHIAAGDVVRARAREQGYVDPIPRSVLSKVGDEMKREFGASPITESALQQYQSNREQFPGGLVISGLRRLGEVEACKERGATVLWLDADDQQRFKNLSARGETVDWNTFVTIGEAEYSGTTQGGHNGVNVKAIRALADCTVANNATLEELFTNADQALADLVY